MWLKCYLYSIERDTRHHSGQNLLWTHLAAPREFMVTLDILTTVDKSTDHANHIIPFVKSTAKRHYRVYDRVRTENEELKIEGKLS